MYSADYYKQSDRAIQPLREKRASEPLQTDGEIVRQLRLLALRKGIDQQFLVRMWASGCLDVELRKMTTW
ncbi:MAG TPA: hypothetical protein VE439_10780 [Anaerolineae bacterium]|nr:hypothetical protein [Anaerolineae bacterium]